MEVACFGVIFLYALCFAMIGAAVLGKNSLRKDNDEESYKCVFPNSSYQIFKNSKNIALYSLNPTKENKEENFYGYKILGVTELKKTQANELKENFLKSVDFRTVTHHFEPRHALRVENDGKIMDILISFKNSTFVIYFEGKKRIGSFFRSPEIVFNNILEKANIEF